MLVLCQDRNKAQFDSFGHSFRAKRRAIRDKATGVATIESSNELFNEVCRRATADLYMLMTRTRHGLYPYAGIPWYSTVFGRDGIITAMLLLWLDPSVAKGVLGFLAETQAKTVDPISDAQPGKILHETRNGEMARLGGSITAPWTQHRFLSCWLACISIGQATSERLPPSGQISKRL
jgi:glycogen debranching enzyme